ncbi:winged helix-turn-helix domain-containing protein [Streptomyces sp. NBC_00513]|uniref:AfsR/SARP family transcriptional regulator n=1 Tax=unclassified Streptomyces TaxID=2593676 RepID=UPI0022567381|nr:BTAD domain-containing putative transcriptional regulator [Streptomyces sp. NBC_00424]MCX5075703.1 winged helix-turn-helix domain-containing protein [Streptomyces sp. NBC_00424]WUD41206.1 winged helix-turn-helix domain-containing protein [Streptomyces sp. NBC_00513]
MRRNLSRVRRRVSPGYGDNGPVRYVILGTAQALTDDGDPVAVGGARLRALLTALALRPGRTVPVELLVAEVWDGDRPADAPAALQALVARLRRTIGHAAVRSGEGGYRLAAAREDVDLYRFERLARAAATERDPAAAAALYDDALALWRGPALASLPDPAGESARWEAVRADARRGRIAAALALGEAERILPELTALCAEHPLDEPLQALRIRALDAAGRPAEALAAYEGLRRDLADRLGADPGPELRALHAALLAPPEHPHAPRPPHPGAAAPAPAPEARPGTAGRSPATPAQGPATPAPPPGQGTGPGTGGNLRARLTTFVGREGDIRVIGADLARSRLVTLLGPGGAGKTRLSQEAAEAHAAAGHPDGRWPDGVWLVELAPVDDPEDVAEAVLAALGARQTKLRGAAAEELRALTERGEDDPLARLVEHCGRRDLLLLLDNCEHVIAAAAVLAERLLTHCPGVQILATSREPLGVPGESLRPVEPLPDPVALRLLADRGAAARPDFRVEDDPAASAEICRRLDGMPLAIELAAARLRLLTPRQIADRLDDRFRLLTSGSRTVLPRQQTLRAVVDWSWDLLDAPERAVLRRLSVFAGGCDLAAAEAVCAGPDADAVVDALGSLVDKSLVVAAPGPDGDMRYRLLETVAEYAAERLAEVAEDRADTERRHLTHYRELARTTEPLLRGHGQRAAAERLATEYENLRTALRRAVAAKDVGEVLCLLHSLVWYWHMHDLRVESRHWSDAAVALGPDPFAPPIVPAEPVYERVVDSPPPYTGELLAEAWRGARMIHLTARDQNSGSWNAPDVRLQVEGMIAAYRPGLPQTCRFPTALWIYAVMIAGDPELLRRIIDETVETTRALGYRWELGSALQLRANVRANRAASFGDAARDAEESLAVFRELGDDWGCAEALSARAEALEKRGEYALAAADFRAAIEHAERLGAPAQVTVLRVRMAGTLAEEGRLEEAEEILTGLLAVIRQYRNEAMPAARMFLANLYGRTGRLVEARAELDSLREEFAFGAYAIFDGFLLGILAWLDNKEGRHEEALTLIREATTTLQDPMALMVAPQQSAVHLLIAAVSLLGLGGPRDAARLLGAYRALVPAGHFPVTTEREDAALVEESARAALGDTGYEAAYAEGGGLTLEQATALV